jgi:hypothetical protein
VNDCGRGFIEISGMVFGVYVGRIWKIPYGMRGTDQSVSCEDNDISMF